MEIIGSIIHKISKKKEDSGPDSVSIKPREKVLPVDELVGSLTGDILRLYGKLSNAYGTLAAESVTDPFPGMLSKYIDNSYDMVAFSKDVLDVIAKEMSKQRMTTTSYPILIHYRNQGSEWLLIALLKLKEGTGIDEKTLDLSESLSFDVSHLREAARLDLKKWKSDTQPYLSFIKRGSGNDAELSKFFRNALSCTEYTDAKHNTDQAIKAVDDYCKDSGWDAEQKQKARAVTYEYCKDKKEKGQPVNIKALSSLIDDQNPEGFIDYVKENEYTLSEVFSPHPASFNKLRRISKKFGTISIGFDVDDVFSGRISYVEDGGYLALKNPPEELVESIMKAKGEE